MIRLIKENNIWICRCEFSDREIPKQAGFRWNGKPENRYWWTSDPERAAYLLQYADRSVKDELRIIAERKARAIESSMAMEADIEIPVPKGLNFFPFQKAGINFANQRENTLLGDEMGVGKTPQTIGLINLNPDWNKILIICPSSLRLNWMRELQRWLVQPYKIGMAVSKQWPVNFPNIIIINYDILHNHKKMIDSKTWDLLVVDECHYIKNPSTRRTKMIVGKGNKDPEKRIKAIIARRKIFLTGTPIVNRPVELWPILNYLDPGNWSSYSYYTRRYCNAHNNGFGWDVKGSSNLGELRDKLRSTILIRRLKKDVLTELPPKLRQIIEIPANGLKKILDQERRYIQDTRSNIKRLKSKVASTLKGTEEYRNAIKQLSEGKAIAFEELSRIRHDTAVAKIPYVVNHVKDVLESGDKIVLFAHHTDVVNALMKEFNNIAVALTGSMNPEEKQVSVDRFQNDPSVKLFIGSIIAAGVGLTLTASSHVIFAELDWVPGNISQAEDRTHRIGQLSSVLIQHIVLEESLDARLAKTIVSKQEIIDSALDKESVKIDNDSILNTVLSSNEELQAEEKGELYLPEA